MKKTHTVLSVLILFVLTVSAVALVGCNPVKNAPSSSQLDITSELDGFDEARQAQQMAKIKEIPFAVDGGSDYYVLMSDNLGDETVESCRFFSDVLNVMVGTADGFEVRTARKTDGKFISIGDTAEAAVRNYDKSAVEYDGFMVKTDEENNFYILAKEENGLSNGIFTMLEDVFGCMFVRDDFDYIPRYGDVYLDKLDIVNNPDFEWRKIFQYEVSENKWYKKLKNNGASDEGVEANAGWGTWCHSSFTFVDPEIYAAEHPEYFVFEDGKPMQLCLTNPDIYPIIETKMQELMQKEPDKKYWDFSLNDNMRYCECENCARVLEETGSMMGTMLPVLNKLARKFPDKTISTLAYFYNKKVPNGIVCEDNVNIVVAPIATGQLYTYKNGDTEKAEEAQQLISEWSKVAKSIFVWDYVVNFNHLLLPFPNFDVQKDNHDFYLANNVKAIFHQGSREHTDELACLRTYVLSRQVWDNTVDINKVIAKYLKVTYGNAAPYIAEYMDTMNAELKAKAEDLDLYDSPTSHSRDYLSDENIENYRALIGKALDAEKDNAEITERIEEIQVNVLYAKMTAAGLNVFEKREAFEEFKPLVQKLEIARHTEVGMTMTEFIEKEYPKTLTKINLAIAAIAIVPVLIIGGITAGILIYRKKRGKTAR